MAARPHRTETVEPVGVVPAVPDEPSAPTRLVVQRGLFFGPSALVPEDLYAVVSRGGARRERHRVVLDPHSAVGTNTYWGRFHATYWQRWTAVGEVEVTARVSGTGRVRLMASDANKVWRIVAAEDVADADGLTVRLVALIDRFVDGGGLWLELTTESAPMTVEDVRWSVVAPRPQRPTSVVICTYNRVDDCLNTLAAMADDPGAGEVVDSVVVVDQGTDPLESRPRFADGRRAARHAAALPAPAQPRRRGRVHPGHVRGHRGRPADDRDVLLMDDDVLLEPEILIRLTAFATCTTHPTLVGGQMLNLLHPATCTSAPSTPSPSAAGGRRGAGALKESYLLGHDERDLPTVQDQRVDTEYNGWWACLIPAEVVRAIGYPLPLFFQWDDIEYGYRARAHGFPTVALPGAGVWHADFGWKDWDEWHRYFNMRNGLITAALHTPFSVRRIGRTLGTLLAPVPGRDAVRAGRDADPGRRRLPRRAVGAGRRIGRGGGGDPPDPGRVPRDARCARCRRSTATSARCRSSARPTSRGTRC